VAIHNFGLRAALSSLKKVFKKESSATSWVDYQCRETCVSCHEVINDPAQIAIPMTHTQGRCICVDCHRKLSTTDTQGYGNTGVTSSTKAVKDAVIKWTKQEAKKRKDQTLASHFADYEDLD